MFEAYNVSLKKSICLSRPLTWRHGKYLQVWIFYSA